MSKLMLIKDTEEYACPDLEVTYHNYHDEFEFLDGNDWLMDELMDEDETNASTSDQMSIDDKIKKKRIRKKRVRKIPYIPRVVKHDVRRFYSKMIANVLNSHDIPLLNSFLETYAHRELVFKQTRLNVDFEQLTLSCHGDKENPHFSLVGIQPLVEYEAIVHQLNPDQAISITETAIKTRSDSEKSEIVCRIDVSFTRLYDIGSSALYDDIVKNLIGSSTSNSSDNDSQESSLEQGSDVSSSSLSSPSLSSTDLGESDSLAEDKQINNNNRMMSVLTKHEPVLRKKASTPNVFDYYYSSTGSTMPIVAEPKSFSFSAQFVIGLNERRQIESFYFENVNFCIEEKQFVRCR